MSRKYHESVDIEEIYSIFLLDWGASITGGCRFVVLEKFHSEFGIA